MVPGAARVPRAQPPAVRRPDLLHLPLRADGARRRGSRPHKSILVPTAHDEPAIQLEIYKELFSAPRGHRLQHRSRAAVPDDALLDPRDRGGDRRLRRRPAAGAALSARHAAEADAEATAGDDETMRRRRGVAELAAAPRRTRRRRSGAATACTAVRCSTAAASIPGKGCEELIEYFSSYVQEGGDASLVLMGVKLMPLPEEPFIRFAGRLSGLRSGCRRSRRRRSSSCRRRTRACRCSRSKSFAVGTPVLANARSEVLVDHCHKSNAGLYYADRDEFAECLKLLMRDHRLRAAMGRNGRAYVRRELPVGRDPGEVRAMFARLRPQRRSADRRDQRPRSGSDRAAIGIGDQARWSGCRTIAMP